MENIFVVISGQYFGTVISVISVFLAIYFYLKSKKIKKILYSRESVVLIDGGVSGFSERISVEFDKVKVNRLTGSMLRIWNGGNESIKTDLVVPSDPFRIFLKDEGEILSVSIINSTRHQCGFTLGSVSDTGKSVQVGFEFMDPKDGITIEVLHTSGDPSSLIVDGTIIGISDGIGFFKSLKDNSLKIKIGINFYGVACFVMAFLSTMPWIGERYFGWKKTNAADVGWMLFFALIYFLVGVITFYLSRDGYPKALRKVEG